MLRKNLKSTLRKGALAVAMAATLPVLSTPVQAGIILDDWDFDATVPAPFTSGVDFDTTSADGLSRFVSDGQSFVIQEFTGSLPDGTPIPVDGDRFYEVAYLKINSYSTNIGGNGTIPDLIGSDANLYFVIEGGGSLDLQPTGQSTFNFDFWRVSLIADDDDAGGVGSDIFEVANADGQVYKNIIDEFADQLVADSFVMPSGPGDGLLSGDTTDGEWLDPGVAVGDPDLQELVRASYPGGEIAGTVPDTSTIPGSAIEEGVFGATVQVTGCLAAVFFEGINGDDLCDSADPDPLLSGYDWTASGNAGNIDAIVGTGDGISVSNEGTTILSGTNGTFLVLVQNLGDDAAPSQVPEPASLLLLGGGLLGLGAVRRRRRQS